MLIEFRVKNFRSFKDEQVLSMVASSDRSLPEAVMEADSLRLLKTAGIFGPNASGKSNLILAINAMKEAILYSVQIKSGELWKYFKPYRLSKENEKSPISFEVTFLEKDVKYQYGFSVLPFNAKIKSEWLYAYPKGRIQKWFERDYSDEKNEYLWKFGNRLKGDRESLKSMTREDTLFLSVANQWNHEQLKFVYEWFSGHLVQLPSGGDMGQITDRMLLAAQNDVELSKLRNDILSLLRDADIGISDILIKPIQEEKIIEDGLFRKLPAINVNTIHKNMQSDEDINFDLSDESSGTQRLFALAGPCKLALLSGTAVVIDELEMSLHSLLTRELVKLFNNPSINKKGAQLLFATHDTTLLDPELLRRDQIWFIEKDEFGASHLYPLSDYNPRKNEALQKGYLSGRYGAIPILRSFGIK